MASIWEKAILILSENLNSGRILLQLYLSLTDIHKRWMEELFHENGQLHKN